jgi:Protein of unknown function (DUF1232)
MTEQIPPLRPDSFKTASAFVGLVVSIIYLLNPTAGFLELLPDNLPLIGNIDEGAAGALLLWSLHVLRARWTKK